MKISFAKFSKNIYYFSILRIEIEFYVHLHFFNSRKTYIQL